MRRIAREMYFEQGWQNIPRGLLDGPSDPLNYTIKEWQSAKKRGVDPKAQKAAVQEAWAISDSRDSLISALKERGFLLARGDRRGFVLLSRKGEILSLPRALGRKTKEVKARLGDPNELPDLATATAELKADLRAAFGRMAQTVRREWHAKHRFWNSKRKEMKMEHLWQRRQLDLDLRKRREAEVIAREARLHKGLRGLWQRITGSHRRIVRENKAEAAKSAERDQRERQQVINAQLKQRRDLEAPRKVDLQPEKDKIRELNQDRRDIWAKISAPTKMKRKVHRRPTRGPEIDFE